MVQESKTVSGV